jgi:hypothetical protein
MGRSAASCASIAARVRSRSRTISDQSSPRDTTGAEATPRTAGCPGSLERRSVR